MVTVQKVSIDHFDTVKQQYVKNLYTEVPKGKQSGHTYNVGTYVTFKKDYNQGERGQLIKEMFKTIGSGIKHAQKPPNLFTVIKQGWHALFHSTKDEVKIKIIANKQASEDTTENSEVTTESSEVSSSDSETFKYSRDKLYEFYSNANPEFKSPLGPSRGMAFKDQEILLKTTLTNEQIGTVSNLMEQAANDIDKVRNEEKDSIETKDYKVIKEDDDVLLRFILVDKLQGRGVTPLFALQRDTSIEIKESTLFDILKQILVQEYKIDPAQITWGFGIRIAKEPTEK